MTVAYTILQQLGGNKFLAMTGAKMLLITEDGIRFKLARRLSMRITLTRMDDYIVETFVGGRPTGFQQGVYAENLRQVFTAMTGFETSLGTMGATR